jgi:hypothetical protein
MGEHLARSIPNCRSHFYPGEGHFSIIVNRMQEILESIRAITS